MSRRNSRRSSRQELPQAETEALRVRLAEAEETVRAIREGDVDAIVVSGSRGEQVFSLTGSEYVYRRIVETMKEAALTVSLEGRILFCNDQFRKLIKESPERIVGRPLTDFVTPDQQEGVTAVLRKSRRRPVKQRLVFQDTGGVPVPAHISSHVLNQPDGASICIVATDLTELEASTEMLRRLRLQQEELCAQKQILLERGDELRLVMNTVPALIAYIDCRFHYRRVNQGYERWFGLPAREVEGRHVRDVLGRQAWETVRPYLERARAGEVVTYEERMPYRLGEARWVCVTCVPDRDETGRVRGFIAHVTDITERKQADEALQAARGKISSILETMSDCFVTFDRDWRYTYVNAAAAQAFHMTPEQLLGKTLWELWPAVYDLPLGINFRRALQENIFIQ